MVFMMSCFATDSRRALEELIPQIHLIADFSVKDVVFCPMGTALMGMLQISMPESILYLSLSHSVHVAFCLQGKK